MPALPTDEAIRYVVAAYGAFGGLIGAYVAILRKRTGRRRRTARDDER
jgi:hypothetical protein